MTTLLLVDIEQQRLHAQMAGGGSFAPAHASPAATKDSAAGAAEDHLQGQDCTRLVRQAICCYTKPASRAVEQGPAVFNGVNHTNARVSVSS